MRDTVVEARTKSCLRFFFGPHSHEGASVGRPARTYLQQLCAETMDDRDEQRERERERGKSVLAARLDDDGRGGKIDF